MNQPNYRNSGVNLGKTATFFWNNQIQVAGGLWLDGVVVVYRCVDCNWEGGYKQQFTVLILRNLTNFHNTEKLAKTGFAQPWKALEF